MSYTICPPALPGPDQIDFFHEHKLPIVDRLTWQRNPVVAGRPRWILDRLAAMAMPGPARSALDQLTHAVPKCAKRWPIACSASTRLGRRGQACFVSAALRSTGLAWRRCWIRRP
jgi:hypothetical protein